MVGLTDRIAYLLEHAPDATPAALDTQFYRVPPVPPPVLVLVP